MKNLQARRSRPATDTTAGPARTVTNGGESPGSGDRVSTPKRELARRLSGTDEVLLLWHPESDRVELCVRDLATDVSFQVEVAPGTALDAFYHPYAYAARRTNARLRVDAGIPARE